MGIAGWLLLVALGLGLGFAVGRLWPGTSARITELERDRDAAREDLRTYRADVSEHFERTAELFDKVTADYRGLYEHLALGARQLSAIRGESVELPLAEPEQRRLAAAVPPAAAPGDTADPAAAPEIPQVPEAVDLPPEPPAAGEPSTEPPGQHELPPEPPVPDEPGPTAREPEDGPTIDPEDRTHTGR